MVSFGGFPAVNSILGVSLQLPETVLLPVRGWRSPLRIETSLVEGLG